MNKELFKSFALPSVSAGNQKESVRQKEFRALTAGLSGFKEIELEWLLSFLQAFCSRITGICDNTALHFLKDEDGCNQEENTIAFFMNAIEAECLEIHTIYYDMPLDRLNRGYRLWVNQRPGGISA